MRCGKPTRDRLFRGTHWLCRAHRTQEGEGVPDAVSETALLRALVFTFPERCSRAEFVARMEFLAETWRARDKPRAVLCAHGLLGRVEVVTRGAPRAETADLVADMVAFVCRHAHLDGMGALVSIAAQKVAEWYPAFAEPAPGRAPMLRTERMLYVVHAHTGARPFLVLADLAVALARIGRIRVTADAVECVYRAYRALVAGPSIALNLC
jgi:hypothetical protein